MTLRVGKNEQSINRITVYSALEVARNGGGTEELCRLLQKLSELAPTDPAWVEFAQELTAAWYEDRLPIEAIRACVDELPGKYVRQLARKMDRLGADAHLLDEEGAEGSPGLRYVGITAGLFSVDTLVYILVDTEREDLVVEAADALLNAVDDDILSTHRHYGVTRKLKTLYIRWAEYAEALKKLVHLTAKLFGEE